MSRDYKDVLGGALLLTFGAWWSWYALMNYPIGTVNRMGTGMFPAALGIILALFGLAILITGWLRSGTFPPIKVRAPAAVLSSVAAFAVLVQPLGLFPAVAALTIVASLAEKKARPVTVITLALVLAIFTWLVFGLALRLTVPMFRWPF